VTLLKSFFYFFVSIFMVACATADGPIMAYDEASGLDKSSLSTIYLPASIELIEVDGMVIKTPFITKGHNVVSIPAGSHQLALKYVAFWGDALSGSMVRSKPVVLTMDIAPKSEYFVRFKQPQDQWQAEHLANVFTPWLEDAVGNKVKTVQHRTTNKRLTQQDNSSRNEPSAPGKEPLQNLQYWWGKASYKDKKAFENWMGDH